MSWEMLKSEQIEKKVRLPGRSKEGRPIEILLATLCIFDKQGKDEVSLSEFQESIAEFQREFPLGYSFSERFLLSLDLLSDVKELDYRGYIRDYHYRVDALLPKRFLALTPLGRGVGSKVVHTLEGEVLESLTTAVKLSIINYKERWRLWAR
jgi:hypothetical protein